MIILKFFFKLRRTSPPFLIYKITTRRQKSPHFSLLQGFCFQDQANPGGATSTRGKVRLHLGSFLILVSQSMF